MFKKYFFYGQQHLGNSPEQYPVPLFASEGGLQRRLGHGEKRLKLWNAGDQHGSGFVLEMGSLGSDGGLEQVEPQSWTKRTKYQTECPTASFRRALCSSQPGQLSSLWGSSWNTPFQPQKSYLLGKTDPSPEQFSLSSLEFPSVPTKF